MRASAPRDRGRLLLWFRLPIQLRRARKPSTAACRQQAGDCGCCCDAHDKRANASKVPGRGRSGSTHRHKNAGLRLRILKGLTWSLVHVAKYIMLAVRKSLAF